MEDKNNKDISKAKGFEVDNPTIDEYELTESIIEQEKGSIQENFSTKSYNIKPQQEEEQFLPKNAIDTAHVLISNSNVTQNLPEVDKELKLTNLNARESWITLQYLSMIEEIDWLKKQQTLKSIEAERFYNYRDEKALYMEKVEEELNNLQGKPTYFDNLGALRKVFDIATIGRSKLGFERTKQVETINRSEQIVQDKTEHKPGFMSKLSGGFKQ